MLHQQDEMAGTNNFVDDNDEVDDSTRPYVRHPTKSRPQHVSLPLSSAVLGPAVECLLLAESSLGNPPATCSFSSMKQEVEPTGMLKIYRVSMFVA